MSEQGLRRDMIECGLIPSTGTPDDAAAMLRALRREARGGGRLRAIVPTLGSTRIRQKQ